MKRPTLRSATNPTTRHSQPPLSPKEMAPTSPCLQWRPRSVDHCSASPGLGRGLREQHTGVVLQWVGFTHSRRLFCYPKGGGGWTQAPVNTDIAFLAKHSWLCPTPSVLPALTSCNITKRQSWLGHKHVEGSGSARIKISFYTSEPRTSLGQLMWLKEGFELARTAMAVATLLLVPAHQCSEEKTWT